MRKRKQDKVEFLELWELQQHLKQLELSEIPLTVDPEEVDYMANRLTSNPFGLFTDGIFTSKESEFYFTLEEIDFVYNEAEKLGIDLELFMKKPEGIVGKYIDKEYRIEGVGSDWIVLRAIEESKPIFEKIDSWKEFFDLFRDRMISGYMVKYKPHMVKG